ncbi:ribosome assembly RNA-binding protein YhbY [Parvibium lacunae]|uniref:ribosome assembly RNA-binding protein YhbY n=1 Tax=Parvibium lacunae TaxID=1888893 RepID=UPI001EFD90EE|nr:ribosome assembly RNA-binding protein YhbY [Parvibium lacunae]
MPALVLTSAERSELRSHAHALNPVVLIGADGLTPAVMKEIDRALKSHGLIKVRVFGDEREARIAIYEEICDTLNAAPIQHIGKLLVIFRPTAESAATEERAPRALERKLQQTRRTASSTPNSKSYGDKAVSPRAKMRKGGLIQLKKRSVDKSNSGRVKQVRQKSAKKSALG